MSDSSNYQKSDISVFLSPSLSPSLPPSLSLWIGGERGRGRGREGGEEGGGREGEIDGRLGEGQRTSNAYYTTKLRPIRTNGNFQVLCLTCFVLASGGFMITLENRTCSTIQNRINNAAPLKLQIYILLIWRSKQQHNSQKMFNCSFEQLLLWRMQFSNKFLGN